ncbi:hypothetical protein S14_149 [Shewanella sp. phage 1/4]|uniref:hypothetical protein n=1 Tax=Shewanella phage 1/4 TaxID=1458859 RepID=UPI0004F7E4FB|nr:hypothetical protein S14_149 [Shewanella sp. phage 1/4]AHK11258.1 hypothetical protein S14_149 [Shewanella sp. phage 1/4]
MFTLISDDDMWVHTVTGSYVGRQWVDGVPVATKISGLWEPYYGGEDAIILPSGVKSEDTIVILTEHELRTHSNQKGSEHKADIISLEDTTINPNAQLYVIHKKAPWVANASFTLIPTHNEYLAVRKERTV